MAWTIRLFESQEGLIRAAARALENYQANLTRVICLADISTRSPETQALIAQRIIPMVVSSEAVDSHRSIILQDGIDFESRYRDNPLFVWHHPIGGAGCETPDIRRILGKAVRIIRDGQRTIMHFQFLPVSVNPDAEIAFQMYLDGSLNACSVGLLDVRQATLDSHEDELKALPDFARSALVLGDADSVIFKSVLMEVSAVYVGSNPDALQIRDVAGGQAVRDIVDHRMEARERAVCLRARRIIDEVETRMDAFTARQEAVADRIERALARMEDLFASNEDAGSFWSPEVSVESTYLLDEVREALRDLL